MERQQYIVIASELKVYFHVSELEVIRCNVVHRISSGKLYWKRFESVKVMFSEELKSLFLTIRNLLETLTKSFLAKKTSFTATIKVWRQDEASNIASHKKIETFWTQM